MSRELNSREMMRVLKALADPNRLRMLRKIAQAGELICGQVVKQFDLSQPTVSHHLKILHDAGCLTVREQGQRHFISVNRELLRNVLQALPGRLAVNTAPRPGRAAVTGRARLTPRTGQASKKASFASRKTPGGGPRKATGSKGARR